MQSIFNSLIIICSTTAVSAFTPHPKFQFQFRGESDHLHNPTTNMASTTDLSPSPIENDTHERSNQYVNVNSSIQSTKEFRSPFLSEGNGHGHGQQEDEHENENETKDEQPLRLTALIILNSPIETPPSPIFDKLWNISSFRVCADGGANRLYYATVHADADANTHIKNSKKDANIDNEHGEQQQQIIRNEYIPDLIKGDLDSLQPHVREYYENDLEKKQEHETRTRTRTRTVIERDADQDCNDLDKSLHAVREWAMLQNQERNSSTISHSDDGGEHSSARSSAASAMSPPSAGSNVHVQIYVYGAFGGRFDQEMASIQALYRWKDDFQYNIALYTDETFAILLPPHVRNEIRLPFYSNCMDDGGDEQEQNEHGDGGSERILTEVGEGPTVGLIPIGCTCEGVRTEGFKWNLDGTIPLEFGGLVSTSNRAEEEVMVVECLQPLVFTAEMTRVV